MDQYRGMTTIDRPPQPESVPEWARPFRAIFPPWQLNGRPQPAYYCRHCCAAAYPAGAELWCDHAPTCAIVRADSERLNRLAVAVGESARARSVVGVVVAASPSGLAATLVGRAVSAAFAPEEE